MVHIPVRHVHPRGALKDLGVVRNISEKHPTVRDRISPFGLHHSAMLETGSAYHVLWRALVKRWWETVNTIHTPTREWTLVTRIYFGSRPLDVDPSLVSPDHLTDLIGFSPACKGNGSYRCFVLYEQVTELNNATEGKATTDQLARALVLLILSCMIAYDWADHMDLGFIQSLVDSNLIREYDWAKLIWPRCLGIFVLRFYCADSKSRGGIGDSYDGLVQAKPLKET
ncbi:hypothetical protein JCGZ_12217 [Jatropha curcas]|uniref:Aminotransferase-like plant mobile domain-containing protein n=1 Tax=Jatropha curcas TaxID=180498 RepID=A0A067KHV0_JATCU|nr:hypothetical protein JCGZ_12217 [Jatropha curcas]